MIENTKDIDELEFINSFSHSGKPVKDLSRIKDLLSDLGDLAGHIVGFGGRALTPDDKRKYLNSKDTLVYSKNRFLFSMNFVFSPRLI